MMYKDLINIFINKERMVDWQVCVENKKRMVKKIKEDVMGKIQYCIIRKVSN